MRLLAPETLPSSPWRWWYILVLYVAMMLGFVLPSAAMVALGPDRAAFGAWIQQLLFLVLALGTVWLLSRQRPTAEHLGLPPVRGMRVLLLGGIGAVLLGGSASLIELLGAAGAGKEGGAVAELRELGFNGTGLDVVLVLTVAILAPVGEEVLFRGTMLKSLRDGLNRSPRVSPRAASGIALAATSLLFYSVHVTEDMSWSLELAYVVNGVLYGLLYLWGGLAVSMVAHSLNNASVVLILAATASAPVVQPAALAVAAAAPFVTLGIAWALRRAFDRETVAGGMGRG